jgi:flagellar biosynthesis chaperone FliJ
MAPQGGLGTHWVMGVVLVGLVVLPGAAAWGQVVVAPSVSFEQAESMPPRRAIHAPAESDIPGSQRIDELNRHREELGEMARQRQLELQDLREARNARERELRTELGEIYEQMVQVERNLAQIERQQEETQRRLAARAENESARLVERLRNLQAQAEQMQETLQELRDRGGEQREAVRRSLLETREQMRYMEQELRRLDVGPMREPQPQDEPPVLWRREQSPERQERMLLRDRPVMEMQEQLGDIRTLTQQNTEKIEKLGTEVGRLNDNLLQRQERIEALSKPCRPGTVGSAGYGYGWQPNFRAYWIP